MSLEELRKDCRINSQIEDSPSFRFGVDVLCFSILRTLARAAVLAVADLLTSGSKFSRVVTSSSSASSVNTEAFVVVGGARSQMGHPMPSTSNEPKILAFAALRAQAAMPSAARDVLCSLSLSLRKWELQGSLARWTHDVA